MNFKEEYRKYNEVIRPGRALVEEIKETAGEQEERRRHKVIRTVRGVLTAAAACVCVFIGVPVLAANVEPMYRLMYDISPELAQMFRLVQKSDEYQGIRMEVVSVYVYEDEIQAYITLQDMEGDRIDETTDLYDSFSINTPFPGYGGGGYCPVDFDEETGVATFLVTLGHFPKEDGNIQEIAGKKLTFTVREFISKKAEYDDWEVPVSWSEVQAEPETAILHRRGGSYPDMISREQYDAEGNYLGTVDSYAEFLLPGVPDESLSVDGIQLTGMGYINGMLHIQTAAPDILENDNHCELFLVDKEGNKRLYDYKINAFGDTEETKNTDYQDCIFDISPEELENYTLHGHFVTSGFHMEGHWSVTFPLEDSGSTK